MPEHLRRRESMKDKNFEDSCIFLRPKKTRQRYRDGKLSSAGLISKDLPWLELCQCEIMGKKLSPGLPYELLKPNYLSYHHYQVITHHDTPMLEAAVRRKKGTSGPFWRLVSIRSKSTIWSGPFFLHHSMAGNMTEGTSVQKSTWSPIGLGRCESPATYATHEY